MSQTIILEEKPTRCDGGHSSNDDMENKISDYKKKPPIRIIWKNAIVMSYLHLFSLYALSKILHYHPCTILYGLFTGFLSALGITAGVHRLWTHRSYKAKLPLRIFLMMCNTLALQNSIFDWSRDHRSHHKYSETDADPHNAKRGFFFSHIGWLLVRKHPEVAKKGKSIPLDDLYNDPVVMFQRRYYAPLAIFFCFILPSLIPWYFWGESLWFGYCMSALRYCCVLNITWSVNSFAHMFGNRPYDRRIHPAENYYVAFAAIGEGFHNYHHTFPHDYATSEYGMKLNLTTVFIDFMAWIGQATDRRTIPAEVILNRQKRTGKYSNLDEARR